MSEGCSASNELYERLEPSAFQHRQLIRVTVNLSAVVDLIVQERQNCMRLQIAAASA